MNPWKNKFIISAKASPEEPEFFAVAQRQKKIWSCTPPQELKEPGWLSNERVKRGVLGLGFYVEKGFFPATDATILGLQVEDRLRDLGLLGEAGYRIWFNVLSKEGAQMNVNFMLFRAAPVEDAIKEIFEANGIPYYVCINFIALASLSSQVAGKDKLVASVHVSRRNVITVVNRGIEIFYVREDPAEGGDRTELIRKSMETTITFISAQGYEIERVLIYAPVDTPTDGWGDWWTEKGDFPSFNTVIRGVDDDTVRKYPFVYGLLFGDETFNLLDPDLIAALKASKIGLWIATWAAIILVIILGITGYKVKETKELKAELDAETHKYLSDYNRVSKLIPSEDKQKRLKDILDILQGIQDGYIPIKFLNELVIRIPDEMLINSIDLKFAKGVTAELDGAIKAPVLEAESIFYQFFYSLKEVFDVENIPDFNYDDNKGMLPFHVKISILGGAVNKSSSVNSPNADTMPVPMGQP